MKETEISLRSNRWSFGWIILSVRKNFRSYFLRRSSCVSSLLFLLISAVACCNVNEPLRTGPVMPSPPALIKSQVLLTFSRLRRWLALHVGQAGQNKHRAAPTVQILPDSKVAAAPDPAGCWLKTSKHHRKISLSFSIIVQKKHWVLIGCWKLLMNEWSESVKLKQAEQELKLIKVSKS